MAPPGSTLAVVPSPIAMPALLYRPAPAFQAALCAHDADPASRRAEHLARYSFRFDTGAPPSPVPVPRPAAGEWWTLAQTLQEIRLRRATIRRTTRGLRVQHAHLLVDLDAAVRQHEAAVRLWLDLGSPAPHGGWDDETVLQHRWMTDRFSPARGPVAFRPGVSVTDWPRFVASVAERIEAGPDAPCAAGLRRDLAHVFQRHVTFGSQPQIGRRPARAA